VQAGVSRKIRRALPIFLAERLEIRGVIAQA